MAILKLDFASVVLGKTCGVNIAVPNAVMQQFATQGRGEKKYSVLFFLHGLTGDQNGYIRQSNLPLIANEHNMFIVMPDADRSFYLDTYSGDKYWTFITQELPNLVAGLFPISTAREDNFVAGISMGGYGALKVALNYPERFSKCTIFSAVTQSEEIFNIISEEQANGLFGAERNIPDYSNIDLLVKKCALLPQDMRPKIVHFCGTEDFLYQGNCKTRDLIRQTNAFDYTYMEEAGAHNWDFWADKLELMLNMLSEKEEK